MDAKLVAGEKTERRFLHSNWRRLFAVFDTAPLYEVFHQRQGVGTLDARFVESLEAPFFFVLGGKLWRADRVDSKQRTVRATPSNEGNAPAWQSFGGPDVPFETAQEAGRLLQRSGVPEFLDEEAASIMRELQSGEWAGNWAPGHIAIATGPGRGRITSFAGDRINRTLSRLLELSKVAKASSSFQQVILKSGPANEGKALAEGIAAALRSVKEGVWSAPAALSSVLEEAQALWAFSPFAQCLPRRLWAAALVEQSLDADGLIRLLQESTITWETP